MGEASELVKVPRSEEELMSSVVDVLATRATATLKARECAVRSYLRWAKRAGEKPWPLDEGVVYRYVRHLKLTEAALAKAGSVIKALSFVSFLFGVEGRGLRARE